MRNTLFILLLLSANLFGCAMKVPPSQPDGSPAVAVDSPAGFETGSQYLACPVTGGTTEVVDGDDLRVTTTYWASFEGSTSDSQSYFGLLCDHQGDYCPDFGCGPCEGAPEDLVQVYENEVRIKCGERVSFRGDASRNTVWRFNRVGLVVTE